MSGRILSTLNVLARLGSGALIGLLAVLLLGGTFAGAIAQGLPDLQLDQDDWQPRPLQPTPQKPIVLTGKVQTLQEAIDTETDVDWYGWYLAARSYLDRTGGLQCPLGSEIKFHKNGRMEASALDPICRASVAGRFFPLPRKTQLDALILPVRAGNAPPASPEELHNRINRQHQVFF